MRKMTLALAASLFLGVAGAAIAAHGPNIVAQAIADTARPEADVSLDAARKPADMVAFAGIHAGQTVVDMVPGKGYFTRIFAKVVGPKGHVYAYVPAEVVGFKFKPLDGANALAAAYPNVSAVSTPINAFAVPTKADVVFTAQNYHDFHDPFMGPADLMRVNRAVYHALKPGGLYVIIDHSAPDGTGIRDTNTTHRIDAATVRREVEAAGFVFAGESKVLRNPADDRKLLVFDNAIRHHTDQFVYKFRKPLKD